MSELESPHEDLGEPEIGLLVREAFDCTVDVDTAARHLWRLHHEARNRRVQRARRTLTSALAAALLFVTTGAAVAASGGTVPGDSLYRVKRGAERVHLLVSFAPESDARLHLKFARTRLAEAEQVAGARPEAVPMLLGEVVEAVGHAERVGGAAVDDEIRLVRAETGAALSTLATGADRDTAAALDVLAGRLDAATIAGSAAGEPPVQPPAAGGDGSAEAAAGEAEAAEPDRGPVSPALDRTMDPPATRPVDSGGPAEGSEQPAGGEVAVAGEAAEAAPAEQPPPPDPSPPAPPAPVPADKAMPALERLEGMLTDR